jgi:hypothetical protein
MPLTTVSRVSATKRETTNTERVLNELKARGGQATTSEMALTLNMTKNGAAQCFGLLLKDGKIAQIDEEGNVVQTDKKDKTGSNRRWKIAASEDATRIAAE